MTMTVDEQVRRGDSMRRFIGDAGVNDLLMGLRAQYFDDIENSKPEETPKREAAYAKLSVLQDFVAGMRAVADAGTLATSAQKRADLGR
jgi:hypothetical protein